MRLIQGLYALLLCLCLSLFSISHAEEESLIGADLFNNLQSFQTQHSLSEESSASETTAFPFSASYTENTASVTFVIDMTEGAYVYSDSLKVSDPEGRNVSVTIEGTPRQHTDIQGEHTVFFDTVTLTVTNPSATALTLNYQGCSKDGICYPPSTLTASLTQVSIKTDPDTVPQGEYTPLEVSLNHNLSQSFLWGLALCFILGMGLNLTPCVLPMLTVFSAMITSGSEKSRSGIVLRSLAYSSGLSLAYMGLGLIFSLVGAQAQAFFQHPLTTGVIVLLLIFCSLDCMGLFQGEYLARFSALVQQKLHLNNAHSLSGAFGLGLISALIATPCTSAPLAGAALFVILEGDLISGALSFFAIGLGMAFPLFLISIFGRGLFMKAGAYSEFIRKLIALPLLAAALYLVLPLVGNGSIKTWLLTAGIGAGTLYLCVIISQVLLLKTERTNLKVLAYGLSASLALCLSVITYEHSAYETETQSSSPFKLLHTLEELEAYANTGKPLLIDFTADWCTNCKVMEKEIFSQDFTHELCRNSLHCLKFDVTDMRNPVTIEITKHFQLIGVPYILLLKEDLTIDKTAVGYLSETDFHNFLSLSTSLVYQ